MKYDDYNLDEVILLNEVNTGLQSGNVFVAYLAVFICSTATAAKASTRISGSVNLMPAINSFRTQSADDIHFVEWLQEDASGEAEFLQSVDDDLVTVHQTKSFSMKPRH